LVGYGKFGAEGTIMELEKERNLSLDKKEVAFKGTYYIVMVKPYCRLIRMITR